MSQGHRRKAADVIFNQQHDIRVPLDEQSIVKLRLKHPEPRPGDVLPELPANAPVCTLDAKVLGWAISNSNNGSAPGLSGITGGMLQSLWADKQCQQGLLVLANDILNGMVPAECQSQLLSGRLIGIIKSFKETDNGQLSDVEHRPIVMGDSLVKAVSMAALRGVTGEAAEILNQFQYALGVKSGVEVAIHKVQTMLEMNTDWIAAKVDFVNAFNSISRKAVMESLYKRPTLSSIWRLVHFLYSEPSLLFMYDGSKVVDTIFSQEGVRQGDVFGTLLFCLGVHDLYSECLRESGAQGVAISDDLTLMGRPDQVLRALTWLFANSTRLTGLTIRIDKSTIFYPQPHQQPCSDAIQLNVVHGIQIICGEQSSMELLGGLVTIHEAVRTEFVQRKVDKLIDSLHRLLDDHIPMQSAMIMLRSHTVPRVTYPFEHLHFYEFQNS